MANASTRGGWSVARHSRLPARPGETCEPWPLGKWKQVETNCKSTWTTAGKVPYITIQNRQTPRVRLPENDYIKLLVVVPKSAQEKNSKGSQMATNMVVVRLSASPFSFRSSMAFWASTWRRQFLARWVCGGSMAIQAIQDICLFNSLNELLEQWLWKKCIKNIRMYTHIRHYFDQTPNISQGSNLL